MSTHKVEVVQIDEVLKHPNADRLELAKIMGWQVVIGKGNFKVGDLAAYIPVDSILSESLEARLFPPDSKIKLNKHRVRSIKIRGQMSQGMIIPLKDVNAELLSNGKWHQLPLADQTKFPGAVVMEVGLDLAMVLAQCQQKRQLNINLTLISENIPILRILNGIPLFLKTEIWYTFLRNCMVLRHATDGFHAIIADSLLL
jgi:tRNA-binding EMAP/Myf-like protein